MTRVLAAAVVVAQLLDLLTWMAMPRAAEVNPIARALHSQEAWLVKAALLMLVVAVELGLRLPREPIHKRWRMPEWSIPEWVYVDVAEFVAVLAIAAGCVGAGSNLAAISWVNAAEASRPVLLAIPADPSADALAPEGHRVGSSGTDAGRTPAPRRDRAIEAPDLSGRASWYAADGLVAAAGPALRRHLGRGWRGSLVRVSAGGRSVTVRIVDWCQCYKGEGRERAIDLSPAAFERLAPLAAGLVWVRIDSSRPRPIVPPATDR